MKKKLRVVQLACFQSNLGDNANCTGLRAMIRKNFPECDVEFTDWELIDYSWGKSYTQEDVDMVNGHDLLIIGGGGFFEILMDGTQSWTGTRINIPYDLFMSIKVPVVFYSVGIDAVRGGSEEGVARFRRFLDLMEESPRHLVSMRTDGSRETVRQLLGDSYADRLTIIPDAGFFTETKDFFHPEIPEGKQAVTINLGGDLLSVRFPDGPRPDPVLPMPELIGRPVARPKDYEFLGGGENAGCERFLAELSDVLVDLLARRPDLHLVFVPHIYRDIVMGYRLMSLMGFPYCRRHVSMAPFLSGDAGQDYIFDLYRKSALAIGMRFHANVSPLGLGVPTVGLGTWHMLEAMYQEIGAPDRVVDCNDPDFTPKLHQLIWSTLDDPEAVKERYRGLRASLAATTDAFHGRIRTLLERSGAL